MKESDVRLLEQTKNLFKTIQEGLDIDLSASSIKSSLDLSETEEDIKNIMNRIMLLTKLAQYCSIIQGHSLYLQKQYKTPELYGLAKATEEVNRAIRSEVEALRSILSSIREQIKIR